MADIRPKRAFGLGMIILVVALAALLAFSIWAFFRLRLLADNTPMSIHGWIAMALAGVFTLAIGGGLMWLAFFSARKGYDDRARDLDEP
jgi:hypothetical protein